MSVLDEKHEAIARIRMLVDGQQENAVANCDDMKDSSQPASESQAWHFGSPDGKKLVLRAFLRDQCAYPLHFSNFDEHLRMFIAANIPTEALRYEDNIYVSGRRFLICWLMLILICQIQEFKCLTLRYQSLDDWRMGTDIMRCNSDFHGRNRHDCIIVDGSNRSTDFARLAALLRCWLPSGTILDLVLIQRTSPSRWRPSTMWDGCRVVEQQQRTSLILAESAIRGALLCPISNDDDEKAFYVVDTVDGDMYLRLNI